MDIIKEIPTREELYLEIPKGGVGAEIGVCKGMNAINLYFITKPSTFFLVDIWTNEQPNGDSWPKLEDPDLWYADHRELITSFFENEINNGSVRLRKEHGSDFLCKTKDNLLDWVYIDSSHYYDCISIELEMAVQKVKSGGYIMGHDYNVITQAWGSSIIRAVNEKIQNGDVVMEAITVEKWPSYLLRVL